MIRSPATLNRKWPGSMMPAWIGPTGIWKTPSPSTRAHRVAARSRARSRVFQAKSFRSGCVPARDVLVVHEPPAVRVAVGAGRRTCPGRTARTSGRPSPGASATGSAAHRPAGRRRSRSTRASWSRANTACTPNPRPSARSSVANRRSSGRPRLEVQPGGHRGEVARARREADDPALRRPTARRGRARAIDAKQVARRSWPHREVAGDAGRPLEPRRASGRRRRPRTAAPVRRPPRRGSTVNGSGRPAGRGRPSGLAREQHREQVVQHPDRHDGQPDDDRERGAGAAAGRRHQEGQLAREDDRRRHADEAEEARA